MKDMLKKFKKFGEGRLSKLIVYPRTFVGKSQVYKTSITEVCLACIMSGKVKMFLFLGF